MLRSRTNYYGFKYLYTAIFTILLLTILLFFDKYETSTLGFVRSYLNFVTNTLTWPVRHTYNLLNEVRLSIKDHFYVYNQNIMLRQMLLEKTPLTQKLQLVTAQNQILKQQLNLASNLDYKFITAKLYNLGHNIFTDNLVITAHSIKMVKNQPVLSQNGLLGRIYKVSDNKAKILTINDINSRIPVLIKDKDIKAICCGNNSIKLSLVYQGNSKQLPIMIGDEVVTSGDCGIFPPGLIIGRISAIENGKPVIMRPITVNNLELITILQDNYA